MTVHTDQMVDSTMFIVGAYFALAVLVATPVGILTCNSMQRGGAGAVKGHLIGGVAFVGAVVGLVAGAYFAIAITAGGG